MGLTSKAFSDIITFSRSSNATRIGPDGKVQYAPHNVLTYSAAFDNAAWVKGASGVVATNVIAAPDGTVTADKLNESASSNFQNYIQSVTQIASTYTFSVYVKKAENDRFVMFSGSPQALLWIDMTTWTAFTTTNVVSYSITPVGSGWYRCSMTYANTSASSFQTGINLVQIGSSNTVTYAGSTSNGLYAWGAQISQGSIAGDYTPTTSAAVYGPRFDYDPVTLAAKGLLIEEQRTNLATYSEQFNNAAWTKANATISANSTTAPDGTTTADTLLDNTSAAAHYLSAGFTLTTAAYTFSVYVKSAGATWVALEVYDGGAKLSYFNIVTGVTGSNASGNTSTITPVGNGWYRCTLTRTFASTTNDAAVYLASADGTFNYTGTGTSGVYLWGAQLEAGAFATSYIPTVSSSVTRSADVASVNTLSPWFNATEGTLYGEAVPLITNTGASRGIFGMSGGTSSNSISLYINSSGALSGGYIANGGAAQADFTPTYSNKTALAYKLNDVNMGAGGTVGTTDTSATIPTISQVQLGDIYGGTSFKLNGWLRRIAYYPRRLTNAELQALTA